MRSYLAAVIAGSVCSMQAQALAFHVHAAPEQPGADRHTHVPAIHHHEDDTHHDEDQRRHVDADDWSAGGTVITIAVPVGTTTADMVMHAELAEALCAPELQLIGETRAIDVRSHGPPAPRNTLLRGPPTSVLL